MAYETTPENAFDLVIRVGFLGDDRDRSIYLAHYTLPETIDLRLTPVRLDPATTDRKFKPVITHISVADPFEIPGSVIY